MLKRHFTIQCQWYNTDRHGWIKRKNSIKVQSISIRGQCYARVLETVGQMTHPIEKYAHIGNLSGLICVILPLAIWNLWGHGAILWWRHQRETFSALLALCAGNSPVTGEFPAQRPVTRSVDVFFDLPLNKRLSKQSWGWWFETPSRSLWRHRNASKLTGDIPDFNVLNVPILQPDRTLHGSLLSGFRRFKLISWWPLTFHEILWRNLWKKTLYPQWVR